MFSHYHYLTQSVANNSEFYGGFINNEPVAIVAINKFPHPVNKNLYKVGRVVVLPHWQGFGIGMKMVETILDIKYQGCDVRFTTTLPIIQNYLWKNDDKWYLRFQGIRKQSDAGTTASFSGNAREAYLETYRYLNDFESDDKISRTRCPKEKRKVYE